MGETFMRPPPEVVRIRVKGIDAVRREEHTAAGLDHAAELLHGRCRIGYVLEHLQAEDNVEACVFDRDRLDRSMQVGVRIPRDIEADDL